MFLNRKNEDPELQKLIDNIYTNMDESTGSATFERQVDQLVKLYALKDNQSKKNVSSDALVTAGSSLLGILLIIGHERVNVVTSKALGFVRKAQ
jgi:hypothetical protein